jgi:hypothetical protein
MLLKNIIGGGGMAMGRGVINFLCWVYNGVASRYLKEE